jgi:OmpA-OmpF porin, OOP family
VKDEFIMKRSLTALLLFAGVVPTAALAGPQYTAEEIIEHFSAKPAAGDAMPKPLTRGVFIGAAGFGSEAGATAAAQGAAQGAEQGSGVAAPAAVASQPAGAEALAIPMTGAKAGLAAQPAGAIEPLAVAAPPPAAEREAGSYDLLITFDFDSATLTPQARENLDAFVAALQSSALRSRRFAVDGHTDAKGADAYNQKLSDQRAVAVVDYLVAQGVDRGRLMARGFGETLPRNAADPEAAENRRVETRLAQ